MSIRQFNPRRNSRGSISRTQFFLINLTFISAIGLQIAYPLLDGEPLRLVTIATVYTGAGAMLLHSLFSFGFTFAIRLLLITWIYAFLIELIGVKTGWPFGQYSYNHSLGELLFGVPIVVPFAWIMLSYPILLAARRVAPRWVFLYGGFGIMAWDLFLDPQMVAAQRWSWIVSGPHIPFQPEIPLSNAFGWLLAGMGLMALLQISLPHERRKKGASTRIPDLFLLWTWFAGVVGNLFFFDRPGTALLGGIVFGLFLLPYFLSRAFGRAD